MTTERSETIKELAIALAKAQAQIAPASKSAENPHFRSRYADLPAVWDACRKPLTDHGLSVVQMPVDAGEPGRVALMTMLLHTSGEFISSTVSTRLQKDDAQGIGSALTYLRRYALSAMVGVVADEDDDGNAASRPMNGNGAAYQKAPSRPQAQAPRANGNPIARAMELFTIIRENSLSYKSPGKFKDMPPPTLAAEIEKMERLIADSAEQDTTEWDETDAPNN